MIRLLAFLGGLLLASPLALAEPQVRSVDRVVIPVSELGRALAFYTDGLTFSAEAPSSPTAAILRVGRERIELVARRGRAIPADWRSNDRWFQHVAIVVSDIDKAYDRILRAGAVPISTGLQLLPAWNPNAGGIRAVYFRDPDGHPLELIQYPPGKGEARWQNKDRLFLGIDHTAVAAADTERSIVFYRGRLGLGLAGGSENWGIEQERLSAVPGARVRITTLRAGAGIGVELLQYLTPIDGRAMPADTMQDDLWSVEVVMQAVAGTVAGERLRDPDGHAVRLVSDIKEASR
jgi:catechol 2,3-dioxygenase-like lactoylglutathione lyase family enzyme